MYIIFYIYISKRQQKENESGILAVQLTFPKAFSLHAIFCSLGFSRLGFSPTACSGKVKAKSPIATIPRVRIVLPMFPDQRERRVDARTVLLSSFYHCQK